MASVVPIEAAPAGGAAGGDVPTTVATLVPQDESSQDALLAKADLPDAKDATDAESKKMMANTVAKADPSTEKKGAKPK
ncbi:unnamed protein product, partial [Ectocarpus sp. 13 AM-2016]